MIRTPRKAISPRIIREYLAQRLSIAQAAVLAGVCPKTFYGRIGPNGRRRGRPPGSGRTLTPVSDDLIRKYAFGDLTLPQAAALAGVSKAIISKRAQPLIKSHGIRRIMLSRPSRINVSEAQQLYAAGWTLKMLGERYGVTRERIRQKIDTNVPIQKEAHSRTCTGCNGTFQGPKRTRLCESCKSQTRYDRCGCGRLKRKWASRCAECHSRRDYYQLVVQLYHLGYGLPDISEALRVSRGAILCALQKTGTPRRSRGDGLRVSKLARQRQSIESALRKLRTSPNQEANGRV